MPGDPAAWEPPLLRAFPWFIENIPGEVAGFRSYCDVSVKRVCCDRKS
jgi:hypothetical protein